MSKNSILYRWTTESGRHFTMLNDGGILLGNDKKPMLLSGWEPAFAREIHRLAELLYGSGKEDKNGN